MKQHSSHNNNTNRKSAASTADTTAAQSAPTPPGRNEDSSSLGNTSISNTPQPQNPPTQPSVPTGENATRDAKGAKRKTTQERETGAQRPVAQPPVHSTHPLTGEISDSHASDAEADSAPTYQPRRLAPNTIATYEAVLRAIESAPGLRNANGMHDKYSQMAEYVYSTQALTWRSRNLYRAALLWHLETVHRENPTMDTEMAMDILASVRTITREPGERKKSIRIKTIPQHDLDLLMTYLRTKERATPGNAMLLLWISSGLMTGARPNEWQDAVLMDMRQFRAQHPQENIAALETVQPSHVLRLRNSKIKIDPPRLLNTEQSKNYKPRTPPWRFIPLSQDQVSIVASFMNMIHEEYAANNALSHDEQSTVFNRIYARSRKMLDRAVSNLFGNRKGKNYSLYTLRGQFSANARAMLGKEDSYFLMGHASPDVKAASFYGTAVSAHKRFKGMRQKQGLQEFIEQRTISIESAMRAQAQRNATGSTGEGPEGPATAAPAGPTPAG